MGMNCECVEDKKGGKVPMWRYPDCRAHSTACFTSSPRHLNVPTGRGKRGAEQREEF